MRGPQMFFTVSLWEHKTNQSPLLWAMSCLTEIASPHTALHGFLAHVGWEEKV